MAACEDLEQTMGKGSDAVYDVFFTPCPNDNKHSEADNYSVECREYFCIRCIKDLIRFAFLKRHHMHQISVINTKAEENKKKDCNQPSK